MELKVWPSCGMTCAVCNAWKICHCQYVSDCRESFFTYSSAGHCSSCKCWVFWGRFVAVACVSSKPRSLLPPSKARTFPCTLPYVTSWTRPCACLCTIPCTFPCACIRGVLLGSISSCVEKHKTGAYYARYPPESEPSPTMGWLSWWFWNSTPAMKET